METAAVQIDTPTQGVYRDVDFATYSRWRAASNSQLQILRRQTPAHLLAWRTAPDPDTAATKLGRAIHVAILEPDSFDARYLVAAQCTGIKKDKTPCSLTGIALTADGWRCHHHVTHADLATFQQSVDFEVISPEDKARCLAARDAVWRSPSVSQLLKDAEGQMEVSLTWDHPVGIMAKARLDALPRGIGAIVDLKKTRSAAQRDFESSIFNYGYHMQGAWYLDGAEANQIDVSHYIIIAQESEPPYLTAPYRLMEAAIDAGREENARLVQLYADCERTNVWPGFPDEIRDVTLPDWAWAQVGGGI